GWPSPGPGTVPSGNAEGVRLGAEEDDGCVPPVVAVIGDELVMHDVVDVGARRGCLHGGGRGSGSLLAAAGQGEDDEAPHGRAAHAACTDRPDCIGAMASARNWRTSSFFLFTHGANTRPSTRARSSRVSLGSSPATSTQMVSDELAPVSIAVSRTVQIGRPSGVVFCVWSARDLAAGRAVEATRHLTSLMSILSRMILIPPRTLGLCRP